MHSEIRPAIVFTSAARWDQKALVNGVTWVAPISRVKFHPSETHVFSAIYRGGHFTPILGQGVSFGAKFHFLVFGTTTAGLPAGVKGSLARSVKDLCVCALIVLLLTPI